MNYMKKLALVLMTGVCFGSGGENTAQAAGQNTAGNNNQQQSNMSQEERDAVARVTALQAQVNAQSTAVSELQNLVTQAQTIEQNMQNQQQATQQQVHQATTARNNAAPTFFGTRQNQQSTCLLALYGPGLYGVGA